MSILLNGSSEARKLLSIVVAMASVKDLVAQLDAAKLEETRRARAEAAAAEERRQAEEVRGKGTRPEKDSERKSHRRQTAAIWTQAYRSDRERPKERTECELTSDEDE